MSQSLILFRSTNFDGKNKLIYNIPNGITLKNKEIALQSFSFYNSFFNISSAIGNNTVTFSFPVFSATVVDSYVMTNFTWTIADGFYSFVDLQFALQQFMIANKLCLYNATTAKYMYFFNILQNTVQYSVQLQSYYIPTADQASALGFALLSGSPLRLNIASGTRLVAPRITFNEAFGKVIGYAASTFPSTVVTKLSANYDANPAATALSTRTPSINPIDCILLRCNVANNVNSIPNDLLSVTPISSSYGAITQYVSSFPLYVPCAQITTNKIEVSMYDQTMAPITQRDAEITMVLCIRDISSNV
jgi:hypothetical protein